MLPEAMYCPICEMMLIRHNSGSDKSEFSCPNCNTKICVADLKGGEKMEKTCKCKEVNLAMMGTEEIRAHIQECEAELNSRHNKEKEEAWRELRQAMQKVIEAGICLELEDEENYFCISSMHNVDMTKVGTIYF